MVTTQRSTGSGKPATTIKSKPAGEGEDVHLQLPCNKKIGRVLITPKQPNNPLNLTPSNTGGMEDSLISPSTIDVTGRNIMSTPKRKRSGLSEADANRMLPSALQPLSSMSGTTGKGSAFNPIILEEYSPRRKPVPLPPRKQPSQEPHMFQKRHRKYMDRPGRTALAPRPANGSTFTGHRGHDTYRMMNAKMVAEGSILPLPPPAPAAYGHAGYGVPFEVQYPVSAQHLAEQPPPVQQCQSDTTVQYHSPYAQYHTHMGVSLSGDSEDMLRKKAAQMVREYSQPQPHDMLLDDPDETSGSETESTTSTARPLAPYSNASRRGSSAAAWTPTSKRLQVLRDSNEPTDHITLLSAQSSLLISLLQAYAKSTDQRGLREDIAMLVTVQNQRVTDWMEHESRQAWKRRRSNTDSAISVGSGVDSLEMVRARNVFDGLVEGEMEEKRKRDADKEMRGLLSADAEMWQDGSGQGVANVFAVRDVSSQPTSFEAESSILAAVVKRSNDHCRKGVCGWEMA